MQGKNEVFKSNVQADMC